MSGVTSEIKTSYGPDGKGSVRFLTKHVKVIAEDGEVYVISYDNIDDNIIQTNQKNIYYSLSDDEATLLAVRPWDGNFAVQFGGFTRWGENEEARPKMKRGGKREYVNKSGKLVKYTVADAMKFTAILEIQTKPFVGYSFIHGLHYLFDRQADNMVKIVSRSPKAVAALEEFLDRSGWDRDNEGIPFSENVLPYLEDQLLRRASKNQFLVSAKEGWPDAISNIPTGMSA